MQLVSLDTTTQLLDSLRDHGDDDTWSEFDGRYRPVVFGLARRLGLPDADAADVAQQTLSEFARDYQRGRFDRGRGRLRSWILGIARNRAMDALRRRAKAREFRGESGYLQLPATDRLTEGWTAERDRWIVQQALIELRSHSKTADNTLVAFELCALQAVPPDEVARRCGLEVGEVYRIKHRITRKLRGIIDRVTKLYSEDE